MVSELFVKKYRDFPVNERELLRYSGCQGAESGSDVALMAAKCAEEILKSNTLTYGVCYRVLSINSVDADNNIDFGLIRLKSANLVKLLDGCSHAVFLAATIGHGIDRFIHRSVRMEPAKSVFMQAFGAERIETMLDTFCEELPAYLEPLRELKDSDFSEYKGNIKITPRFSPGFGDLPLSIQPEFLSILDTSRKLGITINDGFLMSPSKSVTAIIGVKFTKG